MSISSKVLRDQRQKQKKAKQNTKWWNCTNTWKKSSSSPPCALSLLPDDILLSCFATLSKSDHASLSLVNKWLRSLTLSPDLYKVRSLTGCTENCIFICLSMPSDPFVRWFVFYPKARLVPIRPHLYQPQEGSSVVAHGSGIYIIGGMIGGNRSSRFFYLDGRFHTWCNLPCMEVDRAFAAAGVVDGKIYVFGGCEDPNSDKWGEVFDIEKQTWDVLPTRPKETYCPVMHESVVTKHKKHKKIFSLNDKGNGLVYLPSEGVWRKGKSDAYRPRRGWHVIDNVTYCCVTGGRILWCKASKSKSKVLTWRQVMGLEGLKDTLCASKLVNYGWGSPEEKLDDLLPGHKLSNFGSNMLLFWDVLASSKLEIWCAEISLQKRKAKGEIWGKVEWSKVVMTLDPPRTPLPQHQNRCKILHSVTLNL